MLNGIGLCGAAVVPAAIDQDLEVNDTLADSARLLGPGHVAPSLMNRARRITKDIRVNRLTMGLLLVYFHIGPRLEGICGISCTSWEGPGYFTGRTYVPQNVRHWDDGIGSMTVNDNTMLNCPIRGSEQYFETLSSSVGNTPLLKVPSSVGSRAQLLVKLEGCNPTGSVKDRACVAMLKAMMRDPAWNSSKTLLDASSGNMGCSTAYFGKAMGVNVRIVSSRKLTAEKRRYMEYFGASVETIGDFTIEGNQYCRELANAEPEKWYFLDQLHNLENPMAHVRGTGPEILSQTPGVRAVIGSIGSGGTLLGIGRHLKQINAQISIFAVEAAPGTRLPGTAALADGDYRTPFIEEGFTRNIFDLSVQVSEAEAIEMARYLTPTGLFAGLQTYAVVAAARQLISSHELRGDVVAISGDTGWKNMDTLTQKVLDYRG